jgi:hypothetical protein
VEQAILAAGDFGQFARVADIGGGQGSLMSALLQAHSDLRGVLFDLPHVVATAAPVLAAAGVTDRCQLVGGDMFVSVPEGCDAYVMKYIVHDWDDEDCRRILRSCHAAMSRDARLVVIDRLLGAPNEDHAVKLADLHMLVGPGGQERTLGEFASLFQAEGLRIREIRPTSSPVSLLIVERV